MQGRRPDPIPRPRRPSTAVAASAFARLHKFQIQRKTKMPNNASQSLATGIFLKKALLARSCLPMLFPAGMPMQSRRPEKGHTDEPRSRDQSTMAEREEKRMRSGLRSGQITSRTTGRRARRKQFPPESTASAGQTRMSRENAKRATAGSEAADVEATGSLCK